MKSKMIIPVFFCLLFFACSDNEDNNDNVSTNNKEHYSCIIDNVSFSATGSGVFALKEHDGPQTTRVFGSRNHADTDEKLFSIKIDDSLELNTEYALDEEHFWASLNEGTDSYSTLPILGGSGTITITSRSEEAITGEFSFQLFHTDSSGEMIAVTDGSFNASYQ